jgi:hypothetical protein
MDNDWLGGDFDPYQELLQNTSNIHNLAAAFNSQAKLVEHLTKANQHLQEVIQQLQLNDRKQKSLIDRHSHDLLLLQTEVNILKNSP